MSAGTIPSGSLDVSAALIRELGGSPEAVARAAGVPAEALVRDGVPVDVAALVRFFERSAELCAARDFGLRCAYRTNIQVLGPVWALMRSAETVGGAMEELSRHWSFFTFASTLQVADEAGGVALCYDLRSDIQESHVQVTKLSLAMLCLELRAMLDSGWRPIAVQFRHAAPAKLRTHRTVFGDQLQFDQDRNALVMDHRASSTPLKSARRRAHKVFSGVLAGQAPFAQPKLAMRVEALLRARLPLEPCSLGGVAQELGLPPRTLQHRLKAEGTTFQAVLDRVRIGLARRYLTESSLTAAQIAEILQFSQASALSRFLRRKAGGAPRELRRPI